MLKVKPNAFLPIPACKWYIAWSQYPNAAAGAPSQIAVSILPVWNSFVFFEVTPASFHQVTSLGGDFGTVYAGYVPL